MKKQNILIALLSTALLVPSFVVPASAASISASKAKSIVLADAKVKESALHDYEVEKDNYKGKAVYSIEFESKGVEWEYEVQRSNGKILKKEVEGKVSNEQCISVTKAKKIVFADAKVKEADVKDFDIERNVYKTVKTKEKASKLRLFPCGFIYLTNAKKLADYKPIVAAISGGKYMPTPGPIGSPSVL